MADRMRVTSLMTGEDNRGEGGRQPAGESSEFGVRNSELKTATPKLGFNSEISIPNSEFHHPPQTPALNRQADFPLPVVRKTVCCPHNLGRRTTTEARHA